MQPQVTELEVQAQRGLDALRTGDLQSARRELSAVLQTGRASVATAVMLAIACQRLNDTTGLRSALDYALKREPGNVQALLLKGDSLASEGDANGALACYGYALNSVQPGAQLPPEFDRMLARARQFRDQTFQQMEAHLAEKLRAANYDAQHASSRFNQSLELLSGRKQIYLQKPRAYYFPELPAIQFYERECFPWLAQLEAAIDAIEAELRAVLADAGNTFERYLQPGKNLPNDADKLARHAGWKAWFLWKNGKPVAENIARCPRTMAALADLPLTAIPNYAPNILFSMLQPGQRIEPHTGFLNCRLICHLSLLTPPGCSFRVGNETRHWERGKAWVFNDTIEHEAFNPTDQTRVILLFEIWRPELSAEERRLVSALLEASDNFSGQSTI
jgi:aspartate beta-hydroxylase